MKNTYYDSSHIDAINFFEHTSEFSFCVFFVFEHSEAKSSIWIDPCITFGPDKTHERIRELYKAGYSRQFRYYDDFGLSLVVFPTL